MTFHSQRSEQSRALGFGFGGIALGAALAYWLDPRSGARRRGQVRQKALHAALKASRAARIGARDIANRSSGLAARTRNRIDAGLAGVRGESEEDAILIGRVRAKLGRVCSHPSAVAVSCQDGRVTLEGPILRSEVTRVLRAIAGVRGVREVDDRLDRHDSAGNVSALQGDATPRIERPALRQQNWSPATRAIAGSAGLGLLGWGAAHPSVLGAGVGLTGAGLLLRGLANLPARRLIGIGAGRRAIDLQKEIRVDAPIEEVFGCFGRFEDFPRIMSHVREVVPLSDTRWRWSVDGPAGVPISWDAELTRYERNQVIAWQSVPHAAIRNAGIIRFAPDGGATRIRIRLSYNPPGGAIGHALASALGANPRRQLTDDLMRFKSLIETGRVSGRTGTVAKDELLARSRASTLE